MTIIPRNQWCPVPANGTPPHMGLPAPRVWLHHGEGGTSSIQTAIAYAVFHIAEKGWHDIGYSFVIAEGEVLEGRGPGVVGAHTHGDNSKSHGICIAGNYQNVPPSKEDLDAVRWLLRHGHEQGWWPAPELTGGHRDAPGARTKCPGNALHRLIPDLNVQEDDMPLTDADLAKIRRLIQEEVKEIRDRVTIDGPRLRRGMRRLAEERSGTSVVQVFDEDVTVTTTLDAIDLGDDGP